MGNQAPQGDACSLRAAGITLREALQGLNRTEQHRAAARWAVENQRVIDLFGDFAKERHLVVFQSGNECENWLDPIDEDGKFSNGELLLWDIKPKNVLATPDGLMAVIDAEITILK